MRARSGRFSRWAVPAVVAGLFYGALITPNAHGQAPPKLPLIAILEPGSASGPTPGLTAMKEGLTELGRVEGRTARFEIRYGDWQPERMAAMVKELILLKPDVLYTHSTPAVRVMMSATKSIPVVIAAAGDLLGTGAVKSLARPGSNITGVSHMQPEIDRKRLELIREAVPGTSGITFLFMTGLVSRSHLAGLQDSARRLGIKLQPAEVRDLTQLEAAFADMGKARVRAVLVHDSAGFASHVGPITALALKHRLPTISQIPRFAEHGGLLQYGADVFAMFRRSATHVDKILKGAKPADLPVELPTKVDLIVNLKTARAIGITLPHGLLIRADRVIE